MKSRLNLEVSEEQASIDMTPMLDVVFIMLIFFIVSTTFIKDEGVEINRPSASQGQEQKSQAVIVAIDSEGAPWLDQKKLSLAQLRDQLTRKVAEAQVQSVLIKADKKASTGQLITILDLIKEQGISQVAVATEKN